MNKKSYLSQTELKLIGVYKGMVQRCFNKNTKVYHRYGGRGITICQEWLDDMQRFIEWGKISGYRENVHLDRINNDGNYEPSNCRWASVRENMRNRCNSAEKLPPIINGVVDAKVPVNVLVRDLVKRAYDRRNKNFNEIDKLRKILDANYCFMEFKG